MQVHPYGKISEPSRRVAKNTLLLYFRMLLMMLIGLFTSRVILSALGIDDYGIYTAVGGVVMVFTSISNSIGTAISRYLAFELGKGDKDRLKEIFSSSIIIQAAIALLLVILIETLGLWLLNVKMAIPADRLPAANFVLQCSMGVLVLNLLAVPYNASIIAHEKMSAFAYISIGEAVLKLTVALLVMRANGDSLKLYALLMLAVAFIVRFAYSAFCRRYFEESKGKLVFVKSAIKDIVGFAGWSFLGSSAYVFNTQGMNIVVNVFFGVALNAARGVAMQVENIVKPFVSNFMMALNPQITKSWAAGDKEYCFSMVRKGAAFCFLVVASFLVPLIFEIDEVLSIWLKDIPEHSSLFVVLALFCVLADMYSNSILTLILANGEVKKYYLLSGLTAYLGLPLVLAAFKFGAPASYAYAVFILVYLAIGLIRVYVASRQTAFPKGEFAVLTLKLVCVGAAAAAAAGLVSAIMPESFFRLLFVCMVSWSVLAVLSYLFILTEGEKEFIFRKISKWVPDELFLKHVYKRTFNKKLNLSNPKSFNEKLQWQKLHDRNPLYHKLADKADVKAYVAEAIGQEYIVPTFGVWNSTEEINWDALPEQFVMKCTHDSGSTVICRDKSSFNRDEAIKKLIRHQGEDFYKNSREWAYKGLRRRIIAEKYLGDDINDYKFFCFDGKPEFMFIVSDRFNEYEETKFDFFDMDFNHLDIMNMHPNADGVPEKPLSFELMKMLASKLSRDMPQVRIDFYESGGKVYFGEYTFYHWSGLSRFTPEGADIELGHYFKIAK